MELGFLLFTPLVIPLVMFISSGLNAKAVLTSPEGLFPRYFFVLPAATHRIVQPFMLYAALFAAAQWSATELTALTPVAVVLLTLSATGSIIWVVLTGRSRSVLPWTFCAICGLCLLAPPIRQEQADTLLHVVLPTAAMLKVCGLVGLVYYVGSRRLLSWRRLAVIAAFWVGTTGTVVACIRWNVPQGAVTPLNGVWIAILTAPVLGAVAAPLVLGWNRALAAVAHASSCPPVVAAVPRASSCPPALWSPSGDPGRKSSPAGCLVLITGQPEPRGFPQ